MNKNYCWFFFQKPFNNTDYLKLKNIIEDFINTHTLIALRKIEGYQFSLQSTNHQFKTLKDHEQYSSIQMCEIWYDCSITIDKIFGDFTYSVPLIRILFGFDNIIMYLNRLNPNEFKIIMESSVPITQFSLLQSKIDNFLQDYFKLQKNEDYLEIDGFHYCVLNCGDCCDCSVHTRSPLLGGQYCKYLTSVGYFCMHRLLNPPQIPHDQVCIDYFCGDLCGLEWESINELQKYKWIGTQLRKFQPMYGQDEMQEFFDIYYKIKAHTEDEKITNVAQRAKEIDIYTESIKNLLLFLQDLSLTETSIESKKTIDKIVFLAERSEFSRSQEAIQRSNTISQDAKDILSNLIGKLIGWQLIYQKRKGKDVME
jgi:hypothetical protein